MHQSIVTEQQVLTPRQLAAQVKRLTATPAEWVARVLLDAEGRWYKRIRLAEATGLRARRAERRGRNGRGQRARVFASAIFDDWIQPHPGRPGAGSDRRSG